MIRFTVKDEYVHAKVRDESVNMSVQSASVVKVGLSATVATVTLLASKWVGEGHLYSQVVNIDGVNENCQVDITPSAEQLAIFYNKDIAFVAENENGVVTVYVIGQQPLMDHDIQVTITEVKKQEDKITGVTAGTTMNPKRFAEQFETDETLVVEGGVMRVNTATEVGDHTLPITAAAVNTTVGNIEVLLEKI